MWVREETGEKGEKFDQIEYEFYEKKMVTPRVIHKESALSERIKRQTLANEIIRIRRNTCETERERLKAEQLTRFAWKLHLSGYDERSRREILLSGLKGFDRLLELDKKGVKSLYRRRQENFGIRMLKKHGSRKNWYKGGGKGGMNRGDHS